MTPQKIMSILKHHRFSVNDEKYLQVEISQYLHDLDIPHRRELVLDKKNIIDFMFDAGCGVEVKINGSAREIYRQCERYAQFDKVQSLLLVTNKSIGLPPTINGKPAYVLNISRAWL